MTVALLVAAPASVANPAVDSYSESFPNAKGKSYPGADTPTADPSQLSTRVRHQLRQSPNGKALATIATASALGAPDASSGGSADTTRDVEESGSSPSFITAVWRALGDPPVLLGLLALLAVLASLGFLFRAQRAGTGQ